MTKTMKRSTFLAACLAAFRSAKAQREPHAQIDAHIATVSKPHTGSDRQRFAFGPRLHHLTYELPTSAHSPYNVISLTAMMLYKAQSVSLENDSFVTTGMDDWGQRRMRDLIDSYEG